MICSRVAHSSLFIAKASSKAIDTACLPSINLSRPLRAARHRRDASPRATLTSRRFRPPAFAASAL